MTRDETLIRAALEMAADEWPNVRVEGGLATAAVLAYADRIRAIDPAEVLAKVGAAETTAGSWALDTSTDSEILVKGGCSVIEGNDAHYLLRLIAADTSTPTPDAVAPLVEAALRELVDELRLIGCHANGDARCTCVIGQEAADALEAQAEENRQLREALALLTVRAGSLVFAHHHGNGLEGWHKVIEGVDCALTQARSALSSTGEKV